MSEPSAIDWMSSGCPIDSRNQSIVAIATIIIQCLRWQSLMDGCHQSMDAIQSSIDRCDHDDCDRQLQQLPSIDGCDRWLWSQSSIDGCDRWGCNHCHLSMAAIHGCDPSIDGCDPWLRLQSIDGCDPWLWSHSSIDRCDRNHRSMAAIDDATTAINWWLRSMAAIHRSMATIHGCDRNHRSIAAITMQHRSDRSMIAITMQPLPSVDGCDRWLRSQSSIDHDATTAIYRWLRSQSSIDRCDGNHR